MPQNQLKVDHPVLFDVWCTATKENARFFECSSPACPPEYREMWLAYGPSSQRPSLSQVKVGDHGVLEATVRGWIFVKD
jgi:hypothetical protein